VSIWIALIGYLATHSVVSAISFRLGRARGIEVAREECERDVEVAFEAGASEGRDDERIAFERMLRESPESAVRHLTAMSIYAARGKPQEAIGLLVVAISMLADNTTQPLAVHQTAIDLLRSVIAQSDGVPKVVRA
jgi:hypothetical protein